MRRSLLFIPGNSPGMLQNAGIHQADALILDLEDAVAPAQKDAARALVRRALQALSYPGVEMIVRINPLGSGFTQADITAMVPLRPALLMPTKVSGPGDIQQVVAMVAQAEADSGLEQGSIGLLPLLETALGIENAYAIASCDPRVKAIFLGAEDLSADLQAHRTRGGEEIRYARGRVVVAARAAGIEAYDTPFTDVDDEEGLLQDAALARALGFSGKAAISPRHIEAINAAFSPSPEEISYAREVMAAIAEGQEQGRGAVSLRGKMIDKPIVDRARRVLDQARALGLGGDL
ncbi:MAG: HpcH/HpaI aldolase/citrate lyase family protein [Clostridiales bacterium]|nr:HpcH/HpaI aldolase/citrate lyase family protein [Clostridiales bacterium]